MTRDELRAAIQSVPAGHLRLRVALDLAGKKQGDVARRLGLSQGTVSLMVTGNRPIEPAQRGALAKVLGLSIADLFGEELAA